MTVLLGVATCGSYNCSMKPSEKLALDCVRAVTGREAHRNPDESGVPDLMIDDAPSVAIEVKELTVQAARALIGQLRSVPFYESSTLDKWWTVTVDTPTLDRLLPQATYVPRSPISDEMAKSYEIDGLKVVEDSPPQTPASISPIPIKRLCERLEPLLERAERAGLTTTRTIPNDLEAHRITIEYRRIAGGRSTANAHDPQPQHGRPPGIELVRATGQVSTGDPDRVVARAEEFVAGDLGNSLRLQLLACTAYDERHAFLVLDSLEPEWMRVHEWDTATVPSRPPVLPEMIDAVWITLGHLCWHWHPDAGWTAAEVPKPESEQ